MSTLRLPYFAPSQEVVDHVESKLTTDPAFNYLLGNKEGLPSEDPALSYGVNLLRQFLGALPPSSTEPHTPKEFCTEGRPLSMVEEWDRVSYGTDKRNGELESICNEPLFAGIPKFPDHVLLSFYQMGACRREDLAHLNEDCISQHPITQLCDFVYNSWETPSWFKIVKPQRIIYYTRKVLATNTDTLQQKEELLVLAKKVQAIARIAIRACNFYQPDSLSTALVRRDLAAHGPIYAFDADLDGQQAEGVTDRASFLFWSNDANKKHWYVSQLTSEWMEMADILLAECIRRLENDPAGRVAGEKEVQLEQ